MLKNIYAQRNEARVAKLKQQLEKTKMQECDSMDAFLMKIKDPKEQLLNNDDVAAVSFYSSCRSSLREYQSQANRDVLNSGDEAFVTLSKLKAKKDKNKVTFLLKEMMPQLPMMRRRKAAITIANQAMTLVNVKRGKMVKRRKNKLIFKLPPLLVKKKHTLLNMSEHSPYTRCMIPQRMIYVY